MEQPDGSTERAWHFRQLKWALQSLAIPAADQRRLFPDWVLKADELALDFNHWASVVEGNYDDALSKEQANALAEVDRKLSAMSRAGADFEPELWTEPALTSSLHWADVRRLATITLEAFGWPVESPPPDHGERGIRFIR